MCWTYNYMNGHISAVAQYEIFKLTLNSLNVADFFSQTDENRLSKKDWQR